MRLAFTATTSVTVITGITHIASITGIAACLCGGRGGIAACPTRLACVTHLTRLTRVTIVPRLRRRDVTRQRVGERYIPLPLSQNIGDVSAIERVTLHLPRQFVNVERELRDER